MDVTFYICLPGVRERIWWSKNSWPLQIWWDRVATSLPVLCAFTLTMNSAGLHHLLRWRIGAGENHEVKTIYWQKNVTSFLFLVYNFYVARVSNCCTLNVAGSLLLIKNFNECNIHLNVTSSSSSSNVIRFLFAVKLRTTVASCQTKLCNLQFFINI